MKTDCKIEEEINSSMKGSVDTSQASRSPRGSHRPSSQRANCPTRAAAHAAFCLLGLSRGVCQELDFSRNGWRGRVLKSIKKKTRFVSAVRYNAQPEAQTVGQCSLLLIYSITGVCGNGLREHSKLRDSH